MVCIYIYIYIMVYYQTTKMSKIMPFGATWMDLEIVILSEVSQTKKGKYIILLLFESKKKMVQMNLFTKHLFTKTNLWLLEEKWVGEGYIRRPGLTHTQYCNIKWITNKDLLYNRGSATQYSVMIYIGK